MKQVIAIVVTASVSMDVLLLNAAWTWNNRDASALVHAMVFSQMSLCAIWACLSAWKSYVRYIVLLGLGFMLWTVVRNTFSWTALGVFAAGWAAALAIQSAMICLGVLSYLLARQKLRGEPIHFSLQSLLCWMATLAGSLAVVRLTWPQWTWPVDEQEWRFLGVFIAFGAFNALPCLAVLALFARGLDAWTRFCLPCVALFLLAWSQPLVLETILGEPSVDARTAIVMALAQAGFLLAVLIPARWLANAARRDTDPAMPEDLRAAATVRELVS